MSSNICEHLEQTNQPEAMPLDPQKKEGGLRGREEMEEVEFDKLLFVLVAPGAVEEKEEREEKESETEREGKK